jgi:hypothetical protein
MTVKVRDERMYPVPVTYAKSMLTSKTLWFNLLAFLVGLSEITEVTDLLPEAFVRQFWAVIAVANFGLRFMTTQPVAMVPVGETKAVVVDKPSP